MSKTLIIDPGHGGTDSGTKGFGVNEKDWNLKISLYQYERLKSLGANVGITRTTDITLDNTQRINLIKNKYDYCSSNHFNAFNGTARGVETIHSIYNDGIEAKQLAGAIVKASGLPLRRVFTRNLKSGVDYYYMHRLTGNTTTIITEYGFIDNKEDHDFYKNENNFYNVAEVVVKEWCKILEVKYTSPEGKVIIPISSKPEQTKSKNNDVVRVETNLKGRRVESIYKGTDRLNFYDGPRWSNPTGTFGKGEGWIIDGLYRVDGSLMYKVQNSKGDHYYITASEKYVRVVGESSKIANEKNGDITTNSIVDYLISIEEDHSFTHRKKLAERYSIKNYRGTASQNTNLLRKLRR